MELKPAYHLKAIRTSRVLKRDTRVRLAYAQTQYGQMTYAQTPHGLCWLGFGDNRAIVEKRFLGADISQDNFDLPDNPSLDLYGTVFQASVWHALLKLKCGETVSYKDIANQIKNPKAVRAVGSAIGHNPISLIIPCHRVIRTDGGAGGYLWGLGIKRKILKDEGVAL